MAPIADLAAQLLREIPVLFAGPLNDVSSLIFYREIQSYLNAEFQAFGVRLFARMMEWAGAISLTLLTLWIIVHGYRITTGQSRDSMAVFVADMAKAIAVISIATGTAIAGGTLYHWVCNQLPNQINWLVADHDGDLYATIDRTFGYMQLGLSSIGDILTADNALLEAAKTRNQGFVIAGTGMPALVAGALLLFYQAMLAMIVGFAPLGVLSLLFKRTESFFWNWLLYLLSTLVAMAVLSVMASYLLDVVCAVAASFWAGKLMGSNPEGINSLALQQGGLGLIFTTLMIAVPPAIARIFKGLLGEFTPFSAFSAGWSVPFARNAQSQEHAHTPAHTRTSEQADASTPTHAHRVSVPAQARADEIKQEADTRSFSERYPNAIASLEGHGGSGDPLPVSLRGLTVSQPERLRTFSDVDIQVTGASDLYAPTTIEQLQKTTARDLNVVDHMLRRSGNKELADKFRQLTVELNLDDWKEKYAGSQNADAYAQAYYVGNRIELNAGALKSADTMHYRVSQIAHELRHLMKENNDMKSAPSGTPSSEIEGDGKKFAADFMKKYWIPEYEFYGK